MTAFNRSALQIATAVFFFVFCWVGSSYSADDMAFRAKEDYPAGAAPASVAVGDFNVDGIPDLAVANASDNNVMIFKAIGDGTFQAAGTYPVGMHPYFVAAGDLNGDGKQDLIVTNSSGNSLSVLINNGNGTFKSAVDYPVGNAPIGAVIGKFHGGSVVDIAVANNGSNTITLLRGNGDGTFNAPVTIGAGLSPYSLAAGDYNSDGYLDLAVTHSPNNSMVSILLGNGSGTFQAGVNYAVAGNSWSVATGDFNGDGVIDLAVANVGADSVSVLLGNGNGTFQAAVNYIADYGPSSVNVGDFNSDGFADLYVTNFGNSNASILLGNGDGTFQAAVNLSVGLMPFAGALGDFNGDGKIDLVAANFGNDTISILLDNRGAIAVSPSSYDFGPVATGGSAFHVFTIKNVRNADSTDLLVSGFAVTGGRQDFFSVDAGDGLAGTCGSLPRTIAAGTNCTITVTFAPTAPPVGAVTTTLRITSDDPSTPTKDVALSGRDGAYTVSVVQGANGAVACSSPVAAGSSSVCAISPSSGYYLATLTDNGTDKLSAVIGSNYTISNISADHTITATFTQITYVVTVTVPGANGAVVCAPPSPVATGTSPVCAITPDSGYQLATLTDNGSDKFLAVNGNSYTIVNITANHTITATFSPVIVPYTVSVVQGANGTIDCPSPVVKGTSPVCTITPGSGYQLTTLVDNGNNVLAAVSSNSYTISNISADHTITAAFSSIIYVISVTAPIANGAVVCTPSPVAIGANSVCTIAPAAGYRLATLTDNGSDMFSAVSSNSYTISNVSMDHTITATFSGLSLRDGIVNPATGKNAPDISDALAVLRHTLGRITLSASQLQHADVAPLGPDGRPLGNSTVDVADVIIILRRTLGIGDW